MSDINNVRPNFFPNSRSAQEQKVRAKEEAAALKRNDPVRSQEIQNKSKSHAKVDINESVKDFSTIKSAVDQASEIDQSEKIAELKAKINSGEYQVDYDALADRIIESGV